MKKLAVLLLALLLIALFGCGQNVYRAEGAENYDKAYIVRTYHGDLDSDLSIFPDELTAKEDRIRYEANLSAALFDTDAQIILYCEYAPEQFEKEISRLEALSITIRNKDEQFTNRVHYDTASYNFPAYVAIDGFGNTYEYALIDPENHAIIYIYLAYPKLDDFPNSEYLKKDLEEYSEENTQSAYSMYNHSFDHGKSWVEFDDQSPVR